MVIKQIGWLISCYLISLQCFAIEVYAHRGGAGLAPENTLPAIQTAIALGVDVIDVDVVLTKDNVVVAHHDLIISEQNTRDRDNQWLSAPGPAIKTLSHADLANFNVGSFNPNCQACKKLYPIRYHLDKANIPTLSEVIKLVKSAPKPTKLQIEIKSDPTQPHLSALPEDIIPALVKTLEEEDFTAQVEVHSFDWRNLILLQKLSPDVTTSYLSHHAEMVLEQNYPMWLANHDIVGLNLSYPKLIYQLGGKIWCPHHAELTIESLKEARSLGLKVNVWTVDQPKDMKAMIDMGVDGIITNRPDILRGLLVANNMLTHSFLAG